MAGEWSSYGDRAFAYDGPEADLVLVERLKMLNEKLRPAGQGSLRISPMPSWAADTDDHSLEVRVIDLAEAPRNLQAVQAHFAQASRFAAVDLRTAEVEELLATNLINMTAYQTLKTQARKWHREISHAGACGIHQSNRQLLHQARRPLLVVESDCQMGPGVASAVGRLMENLTSFDVAVFGGLILDDGSCPAVPWMEGHGAWCDLTNSGQAYILNHCVLYSPAGREALAFELDKPQEMHIDAFISMLANLGKLRVIVETTRELAYQANHASEVGHSDCDLCNVDRLPTGEESGGGIGLFPCLFAIAVAVLICVALTRRAASGPPSA